MPVLSFNVLAVRSGQDDGDDVLYPVPSDASSPELITLDAYDGPNVMRVVATAVRVMESGRAGLKTLVRLSDVRIDIYITDGRLALACEKYDKGGGWVGFGGAGVLVAVAANAVSKARAASRSRGKVLVGHIRYPWLKAVGASSKTGFASSEAIRLEYSENQSGTPVRKLIDLTLPKNIDATLVASEIATRAAAYRLAHYPEMKADARAASVGLSQEPPRLRPEPKKFAFYQMPTYFHVSVRTAFPRSARPELPGPVASPASQVHAASPAPQLQAVRSAPELRPLPDRRQPAPGPAAWPAPAAGPDSTTAFCTQCGARHVPGDNFCAQCGVRVNGIVSYQGQGVTGY